MTNSQISAPNALITLLALCFVTLRSSTLVFQAHTPKTETVSRNEAVLSKSKIINIRQDQADIQHTLGATYYSLEEGLRAILMLSNQGPNLMPVQVSLFNATGERLDLEPVTLNANEMRSFDLRSYLSAKSGFERGSLQVKYVGKNLELGGVITLMNTERSLIFDEELIDLATAFKSSRLEGVWWLPSTNAEMRLVLSNTTDALLSVSVSAETTAPKQKMPVDVALGAHETRVLSLDDIAGKTARKLPTVGGISINHSGVKGGLLARAMVEEPATGYSDVIEFSDPGRAKTSKLNGAGLRIGEVAGYNLTQAVVAHNIGDTSTALTGRIPYTRSDGKAGVVTLAAMRLAPGEVRELEIATALKRSGVTAVAAAGLELEYTGEPGSIVVSARSVSRNGTQVFRIPLGDAELSSSTGIYPWSLEGNSSPVVYIKNVVSTSREYTMSLAFEGGEYVFGIKTLAAGQTAALDLRALRDHQVPDINGKTIPLYVTAGKAHWSMRGQLQHSFVGRLEQVDLVEGISFTAACGVCCPSSFSNAFIDPSSVIGAVGGSTQFTIRERDVDCFGNPSSYYPVNAFWFSTNTSVATVNSSGGAAAVGVGTAFIKGTITTTVYENCAAEAGNQEYCCNQINDSFTCSAECDVLAPTLTGPSSITRAGTATFTISNVGNGQVSGWQFSDGTNTVTRTTSTGSTTWSGVMVISGTVSVTVNQGGNTFSLSKSITVNARTGFAFSAVSASKVANGSSNGDGGTISTPNPPVSGGHVGSFHFRQKFSFQTTGINDGGPNQGFKYVTSLSNTFNSVTTAYLYVVPPDLENTSSTSTFYMMQCGNYNAQTNPGGFISGANLLAGVTRHEAGSANSHYNNYVIAQTVAANNLGVVGEMQIGAPSVSLTTFASNVTNTLNAKSNTILQATQVEPCAVNSDNICAFLGNINFSPYQSCQ